MLRNIQKMAIEAAKVEHAMDNARRVMVERSDASSWSAMTWPGYLDDVYKQLKKEEWAQVMADIPAKTRVGMSLAQQYVNRGVKQISRDLTDLIVKGGTVGDMFRTITLDIATNVLRWSIETELNIALNQMDKLIGKFGSLGDKIKNSIGNLGGGGGAISSAGNSGTGGISNGTGGALGGSLSGGLAGAIGLASGVATAVFSGLQYFQGRRMEQDTGRMEVSLRGILSQSMSMQTTLNSINAAFPILMEYLYGPQLALLVEIAGHLAKISADGEGMSQQAAIASYQAGSPRSILGSTTRELMLANRRFQQI